jgi:hypothetical protein
VLVSGDCKRETGFQHAGLIQTVLDGIDALQDETKLRVVSIASDGETRRGSAFILLTFKNQLSPQSPIYSLLHPLKFLNLHVGDDDLTCDKDWKHVFKRFRNLLLRQRGLVIIGFRITPDIIRDHLKSNGLSADHIRALFNPEDKQDVKMAFDLLKDIWKLPRSTSNARPGFQTAREAIWLLGKLLFHMVFPYLCVDLALSEQIDHFSAAAHLALALFKLAGKEFIPTNLYIDLMIMIKNVLFCVAKAKVDTPNGRFWVILCGTDRLEELFGILRTMIGNDANLDILQLVCRLAGTTEISNILAKYPQWDRSPRRLNVPAISRESEELPDNADHIKPASWRGNVDVKDVSLQTSWNRGRHMVEQDCEILQHVLKGLEESEGVDMLAPFGTLLFDTPLDPDDVDDSLEISNAELSSFAPSTNIDSADLRVEVEDSLGELAVVDIAAELPASRVVNSKIIINGKETAKARALSRYGKYRKCVSSTDRLRRVQEVERYAKNKALGSDDTNASSAPIDETHSLIISDPITTLICSDDKFWLCVGEVNGLKIDGQSADYISHDMLPEDTVTVSYQMLGLRPATLDDDTEGKHDWRTYAMEEQSFMVPGRLIQPVNPSLSAIHTQIPFYLFQSPVLIALAASIFQGLMLSHLKSVPKMAPTIVYPYREASGK